jgi:hypothetical protein
MANDGDKNPLVLPDTIPDMADKLHILRCSPAESPMPTSTEAERVEYCAAVATELPYLIKGLLRAEGFAQGLPPARSSTWIRPVATRTRACRGATPSPTMVHTLAACSVPRMNWVSPESRALRIPPGPCRVKDH